MKTKIENIIILIYVIIKSLPDIINTYKKIYENVIKQREEILNRIKNIAKFDVERRG